VERYEIEEELGRGGMGVVHAAFDTSRGRPIALKRLLSERFRNRNELARATTLFEREYHTLSQLAHPNIISVFDYGIDAQGPYYTMERLSGVSLRACAPLPWIEASRLIRDVASALAIIHSRRLMHRDVTPLNVYRSEDGSAK
jgi:serine/threonine-protein kinase